MTKADRDAEPLELLDRIAARVPDLDLDQQHLEWMTLPSPTTTKRCSSTAVASRWQRGYFAFAGKDLYVGRQSRPARPRWSAAS